jgi:uncharacterized protein
MENVGLMGIFLTGLLAGGLSCVAVQGGLLAATIAQRSPLTKASGDKDEERLKKKVKTGNALPILIFLLAKLVAYTLLGVLLGWFGSLLQFSISIQVMLQFLVAIFMIGTALNILSIHPIFRYFIIQPPRFLTRLVRKQSKSTHLAKASRVEKDIFAPALLGAFTVLIPCGTTQAMMALAVGSGTPLYGGIILFVFVLGTSPIFFLLGYFTTKLSDVFHRKFMNFTAYVILLLAIFNINNAASLTGSHYTLDMFAKNVWCTLSYCDTVLPQPVNLAGISIEASGYNPSILSVKRGSMVTLNLTNTSGSGCTQAFTVPGLGIQKIVPLGTSDTITFRAPESPQQLSFMCSMGMYKGIINVL